MGRDCGKGDVFAGGVHLARHLSQDEPKIMKTLDDIA